MGYYIALLQKDSISDYIVTFPDFPGCTSTGAGLQEARVMGVECLASHVEGLIENGGALPEPSSLEVIMRDPQNRNSVATLIPVDGKAKVVRVTITLPEAILREIDQWVDDHGGTRSSFMTIAAKRFMEVTLSSADRPNPLPRSPSVIADGCKNPDL